MITARKIEKIVSTGAKHSLYRKDGKWFHHLKEFPGVLFDENGYIVFDSKDEYITSPFLRHRQDLNVIEGIEQMPGYKHYTQSEKQKIQELDDMVNPIDMFRVDQEYDRSRLLEFVGSKQGESGIIWGDKEEGCVIVTSGGKGAQDAGYEDGPNDDGTFFYIGQGKKGDQNPYSFANSLLSSKKRTVLLFLTREPTPLEKKERNSRRKFYKFSGIYEVASWDFFIPYIGPRKNVKLVRFLLVPAKNIYNIQSDSTIENEIEEEIKGLDLSELRNKILATSNGAVKSKFGIRNILHAVLL
jgi:hypothetical protein